MSYCFCAGFFIAGLGMGWMLGARWQAARVISLLHEGLQKIKER